MIRLIAFALTMLVSQALFAADYRPNEILVKYKEGLRRNRATMEQIYDSARVVKVKRFDGMRSLEQLFIEEGVSIKEAIKALEANSAVEYAQPNHILKAFPVEETQTASADDGDEPGGEMPCIPGMEIPGCTPIPCIIPNFPPGCEDGGGGAPGPGNPGKAPVADKPSDVNPPVADPELEKAYGISKVGAPDAWKKMRGSQDVVVAVIDTGVDYNHEDLSFNMWRNPNPSADKKDLVGYDFVHDDGLPFDDHAHGTHCAGSVGAVGGNGKGVSGVTQRVSIMALKFLDKSGSGDEAAAIRAIDYAVAHGAKVLSNSWGGRGGGAEIKALKDAVIRAQDKGVLFVAAAGNDGTDNDKEETFPAGFNTPNMVAVAATDQEDDMAYFSNYGKTTVHVGAPGVDVYSSVPGNKYKKMSGTSMACPHVAGAAALVWAANPSLDFSGVKKRLMDTADPVSSLKGKTITGGRINVNRAIDK